MTLTGLKKDSVYSALKILKDEGLLTSHQSIDTKTKKFGQRTFKVSTRFISIFVAAEDAEPLAEIPEAALSDTAGPDTAKSETQRLNESQHLNNSEQLNKEGEGTLTPAPNPSNLQSQKNESGLVSPPAENPETVKAEIPPSKKVAPKKDSPGDEDAFAQWLPSLHTAMENNAPGSMPNPAQFEVTAIASPTDLPGVTIVEAAPPLKRANTILAAEQKILDWATGDGLATIAIRHGMSKRVMPEDLAPLVAHYCSVYASTNEGSRASLLRDPVAHFEAGIYKYLTMQNTIDRNNAPKEGGQVRNVNVQNGKTLTSNMRVL